MTWWHNDDIMMTWWWHDDDMMMTWWCHDDDDRMTEWPEWQNDQNDQNDQITRGLEDQCMNVWPNGWMDEWPYDSRMTGWPDYKIRGKVTTSAGSRQDYLRNDCKEMVSLKIICCFFSCKYLNIYSSHNSCTWMSSLHIWLSKNATEINRSFQLFEPRHSIVPDINNNS